MHSKVALNRFKSNVALNRYKSKVALNRLLSNVALNRYKSNVALNRFKSNVALDTNLDCYISTVMTRKQSFELRHSSEALHRERLHSNVALEGWTRMLHSTVVI